MKKKSLVVLLMLVFLVTSVLAGCGSSSKPAESKPAESKKEEPKKVEEVKAISLKLAHSYAPTHLFHKASENIAAKVKEKSGGKLEIKVFPAAQLGSEKDICDSVSANTLDMAIIGPGEMGKRYKPVLIFDGPFIFRDVAHAMKVANGDVGTELWTELAKVSNIKTLKTWYYGTRFITTSKKEVKTPADMKGLKLRVPNMPMSVANAKAMGASPTPMALSEVYLALQQNTVDGQENPIATIMSNKFNEVQNFLMLSGHVVQVTPITISQKKFDSLPDDLKKILADAVAEETEVVNKQMLADEDKMVKDFGAMPNHKVVEVDKEAFRKATQSVIKEFENDFGKGLYEKIQAVK